MTATTSEQPTSTTEGRTADETGTDSVEIVELVEADLLVEDVSIDGMCGVY